jgi:hypothetical protein|tara:strand:+ start:38 stop:229 length:192 start_codon:yes stop_codon:yes gene_type:complete
MKKINQVSIYLHKDAIEDKHLGELITEVMVVAQEKGWLIDLDERLVHITDKEYDKLLENADYV